MYIQLWPVPKEKKMESFFPKFQKCKPFEENIFEWNFSKMFVKHFCFIYFNYIPKIFLSPQDQTSWLFD